jgi:uncharacterized protein YoxC
MGTLLNRDSLDLKTMEIVYTLTLIIPIFFIAFMLMVDWRLAKIYSQLKQANETLSEIDQELQRLD